MSYTHTNFEWNWYDPDYTKVYDKLNQRFKQLYSKSAFSLAGKARIATGHQILEVGAGTGVSTEVLCKIVCNTGHIYMTDVSEQMLTLSRKHLNKYKNITTHRLNARDLPIFIQNNRLEGKLDRIFSSFGYYYIYKYEDIWMKAAFFALKQGGILTFNVTNFLGEFKIDNKLYNSFVPMIHKNYDDFLKRKGFKKGIGQEVSSLVTDEKFTNIRNKLEAIEFNKIQMSVSYLPINCYEALVFMIEGFYKYGSSVNWSSTIQSLPLRQRYKLLIEGAKSMQDELMQLGEYPAIVDVIAQKDW